MCSVQPVADKWPWNLIRGGRMVGVVRKVTHKGYEGRKECKIQGRQTGATAMGVNSYRMST